MTPRLFLGVMSILCGALALAGALAGIPDAAGPGILAGVFSILALTAPND